ncbi:MAG TPA: aldolase/citrate lyase family protein [Solirubrobacteraceae bacterium]|nr:aldolase/citrate lyase family protein [Solirubrobacteraceae bacterium]
MTRLRSPTGSERYAAEAAVAAPRSERGGFLLTLWTDDPDLAARADAAGIDRIGVDLERAGKRQRQAGLDTWISPHSAERLVDLRAAIVHARLFARVNPLSAQSGEELERLLELGVQVVMLPMFENAEQVARFIALVDRRAEVVLLLETSAAVDDIERIVCVPGVREIHVGINDLALSLGMGNRFSVLDCEPIERVSNCVRAAGLRFGIGGIGRAGDHELPIPSELIYAQYPRLGATAALVSRAYLTCEEGENIDLINEVARSRELLAHWSAASPPELRHAQRVFRAALAQCKGW